MKCIRACLFTLILVPLFGTSSGQSVWVDVINNDFSTELQKCIVNPTVGGWYCPGAQNWLMDGEPTWDRAVFEEDGRLWCMGSTGEDPSLTSYLPNMDAVASFGPVELTDATDVKISFDYFLDKEAFNSGGGDLFEVGMSADLHGEVFRRFEASSTPGWRHLEWRVSGSPDEIGILGESQAWFVLRFLSDSSNQPGFGVLIDNLSVKKEVPLLTQELLFSQFGNGRVGATWLASQVELMNPGAEAVSFAAEAYDHLGNPMAVLQDGLLSLSVQEGKIEPGGTAVLLTGGTGPLKVGSLIVRSDRPIVGYVLFQGSIGEAAVYAVDSGRKFMVPVEPGAGVRIGLALMGLGSDSEVTLKLRNRQGVPASEAQVQLQAFSQKAQFLDELVWTPPVDVNAFSGSLTIQGTADIATLLLRQGLAEISTLPVIRLE